MIFYNATYENFKIHRQWYIWYLCLACLCVRFLEIRRIKSTNTAKEDGSKQTGTATKKQKQEMQEKKLKIQIQPKKRAAVTRRMRQTNRDGHRGVYGDTGIIAALPCCSTSTWRYVVFRGVFTVSACRRSLGYQQAVCIFGQVWNFNCVGCKMHSMQLLHTTRYDSTT